MYRSLQVINLPTLYKPRKKNRTFILFDVLNLHLYICYLRWKVVIAAGKLICWNIYAMPETDNFCIRCGTEKAENRDEEITLIRNYLQKRFEYKTIVTLMA